MNIAEVCFNKRTVVYGLALAVFLAGVKSYFELGRLEDPEFTIREAQIVTAWPGATAEEVAESVTDPIETAVQRLGKVNHVVSTSKPGLSIISVEIKDNFDKNDLPQIWDELRNKVGDMASTLPEGCDTPVVDDDYGDVYGVFYAISGDGFSMAELKEHAKFLRRELLLCDDVAKIDMIGERQEVIYFEIATEKLADLGVSPSEIAEAIRGRNVPSDAGHLRVGEKYIRLYPTGRIDSPEKFGEIALADNLFLKDVVQISRGYEDPPSVIARYNGKPCVGLGISTVKGGNVIKMCESVDKKMAELIQEIPLGIEMNVISHQATSVNIAVNGFLINLVEAVILVIAVLLFSMGLRSGLLIGGVLILTVMATIMVMAPMGLMFERISLGAFIIALGMLVDNAIVITEAVLVAAEKGEDKLKAAVAVVKQTQWALLGGTAIAILSFAPIGASQNTTGEYCNSLFLVIAISLLLSWIFAITITPLLAERFLKASPKKANQVDPYGGWFFKIYRVFLEWCVQNRGFTLFVLLCLLFSSVVGFTRLEQNFFPDSTRPQFMIQVWMPEGTLIYDTDENVQKLGKEVAKLEGVKAFSTFTGSGALRFLLTYAPENPDPSYGIIFVDVESEKIVNDLIKKVYDMAPDLLPDAMVGCERFVLGPGDAYKIQMRLMGPDKAVLRDLGEKALDILRADGGLCEIKSDWRNKVETVVPIVAEKRANRLGLSRAEIARAYRTATDGYCLGSFLEGDETLPILLRVKSSEREHQDRVNGSWVWSDRMNIIVPVAQLLDGEEISSEEQLIQRRERSYCLTVKCNPFYGENAAAAFDRVRPALEEFGNNLPVGYHYEWGGEYEDSNLAQEELVPSYLPIISLMVLMVLVLFNSVRKTLVIYLTLPLIVIGVVAGLSLFHAPFGFMALLGFLSLVGMQVKNAIVLMDEIGARQEAGDTPYDAIISAGVSRVRPVSNAALTTILGMLPLIADPFYSAMAITIMFGLAFSTILTVIVVPVNYALIFRVQKN